MLTMRDCLDYCDVTLDEVSLVAEHEGWTPVCAAQVVCGLVQTDDGVKLLYCYLQDMVSRAEASGDPALVRRARRACARFAADHPLTH